MAVKNIASRKLINDLRRLIAETRQEVAQTVNSSLVALYWNIGVRIRKEMLKEARAEYGQRIVHAVSAQLSAEYGDGFSIQNLWNMIRFSEVFPDEKIVYALRRQLSWTHFRKIIYLDDPLQLDKSGIRVASYMTELPPRKLLQKKLHEVMIQAQMRLQQK